MTDRVREIEERVALAEKYEGKSAHLYTKAADLRYLLDLVRSLQQDAARLDKAQRYLFGADFEYEHDGRRFPALVLSIPTGGAVSGNLRATLDSWPDAALSSSVSQPTERPET